MNRTQVAPAPPALVAVLAARPDDEERVTAFVAGLSPRSRTLRFFTGMPRVDRRTARALVAVDDRRDVLLAVDGDSRVVGHAMGFLRDDTTEIAVVVADGWQGMGVGSRLVRTLLRRAAERGARNVGMDVMGENRRALQIIRHWWPDARTRIESGTVEVVAAIAPARAPGVPEPAVTRPERPLTWCPPPTFAEQGSVESPLTL
ncbi:GNAT family N-acetyltransferase [Sphaerisporangium sp. TRM90804]|uniref:GNAT family N-acetyltransferase n=1 Tax=Sphaerisporangium sp. TRM90804 TaxID=3031113 RepID=UPI00244A59C1|nr:GNAT family N-acetyltransferase [Sphaerisporangium sp. TRM90804]MDH2425487.1 GNAT family N-acetyltransferase [Sphaerisporangium sp. TRM90804]